MNFDVWQMVDPIKVGAKWNNCIPQDIDTSCWYDNDPR